MRSKRWVPKRLMVIAVSGLLAASLSACTPDFLTNNEASVILRVVSIAGEAGQSGQSAAFINSDVSPIFNDNATVTLEVLPKNPNFGADAVFEDVLVTRYEVSYVRSDGHNREGVDVPFRISGGLATLIHFGAEGAVSFVVVRHQAKFEPPLSNLVDEPVVLTCIAQITLHGQTTSGRAVTVSGFLTINFSNFQDS